MLYVHFCHISTYKKYTKHKKTTKVQCHFWITLFIYDGCSNADRRCLKTFDYPLKITITRWRVCWRFMPKQKQLSAINKHCHAKFNSSGPFTRLGSAWTDEPFPTDFRHSRESGTTTDGSSVSKDSMVNAFIVSSSNPINFRFSSHLRDMLVIIPIWKSNWKLENLVKLIRNI